MKTILLILLTITAFLGAETRQIKVVGNIAIPLPDKKAGTHTLELTKAQYDKATSPKWFKVVDGLPVLKTDAEVQAEDLQAQKDQAKRNCDLLYKELRKNFLIQETETYEFDLEALLLFDSQVKNKADNIKTKEKGKKIKALTKSKATAIMNKVNLYLESLSDAYNLDWDAIEADTLTLSNLKAIQDSQEALK